MTIRRLEAVLASAKIGTARSAATRRRCRQELRHGGIRRDVSRQWRNPACRPKRRARRRLGHRRAHDTLGGLRHQPAQAQTYRAGVWLGQDDWPDSAGHVCGRERVEQLFLLTQAAYNLTRMRTLAAKTA